MFASVKKSLLRLLRVPDEPDPPAGHDGTLRVFRAAPMYFRYKLVLWAIGQLFTLLLLPFLAIGLFAATTQEGGADLAVTVMIVGTLLFLVAQVLLTFLVVRLDYEMRWYLVTDQSLRIREGVMNVREMTMTFANIQNISISQGPLQRILGVADLEVKSAGGGGAAHPQQQHGMMTMHTGYFRGVDNAEELRDLMRERMRRAKDAGLGDLDDEEHFGPDDIEPDDDLDPDPEDLDEILRVLRVEAKALREAAARL